MRDKWSGRIIMLSLVVIVFTTWIFQARYDSMRRNYENARIEEDQEEKKDREDEKNTVTADGTALKDDCFYLKEVNGFIVVYKSDRVTPYEYTSIECETLPPRIQNEVKNGKFIENIRELYSFLENYSS